MGIEKMPDKNIPEKNNKNGKFISIGNQYVRFILGTFAICSIIMGGIFFPTYKRIEGVEKQIEEIIKDQEKIVENIENKLKEKVSDEILTLQLTPIKENISDIKADIKTLLKLWRERNGGG